MCGKKDILGNIIALLDSDGKIVVKYIYDAWGNHKVLNPDGTFLGYALSVLGNGSWMFGKLRKGYTIIDIGITTTHKGMGWYYGIERFVITQWKYRNIWKLPVNLLL